MSLILFYSPKSCSLASHVALRESGLPFELYEVNTSRGENFSAEFLKINPLGKVPAMRLANGSILTESPAILFYIADSVPAQKLVPTIGSESRARAHEWLNFLSSGLHISFRPVLRPERFSIDPGAIGGIREKGFEALRDMLAVTEQRIAARSSRFAVADHFTICDAYLLVYWTWSRRPAIVGRIPPLPAYAALMDRLFEMQSVRDALQFEGLSVNALR
jgi:glutathione S-transferase